MIVFLTLLYVGVLALLVKMRIVPLNTFWKLSPLLWMVLLLVALFIPMQWGAPSGTVKTYSAVVEIIPNVSGEVTDVEARALQPVKQGDVLFRIERTPFETKVAQLEAELDFARVNLERAERLVAKKNVAELERDRYDSQVKSLGAQLRNARWELEQTDVRAPADGYPVGVSLRPGQRVANIPLRSWIAFVESDQSQLVVGIPQTRLRHVRPGQKAEVVLRLHPGQTFEAVVDSIIDITAGAQLQPSGLLPMAPTVQEPSLPYGVRLRLEDPPATGGSILGGAVGTAAIYTDAAKATQVIRRVMLRMESWMNYLKPF